MPDFSDAEVSNVEVWKAYKESRKQLITTTIKIQPDENTNLYLIYSFSTVKKKHKKITTLDYTEAKEVTDIN